MEATKAMILVDKTADISPPSMTLTPMVGRDAEQASLLAGVGGPPSAILVQGEAGVGKTRLVRSMMGHADVRHRTRLVGRCSRMREPFPLEPLVGALRGTDDALRRIDLPPIAGALRSLLPEFDEHLPPGPRDSGDARVERHRQFRGLVAALEALAPIMVLEDMHWADNSTVEFLTFLSGSFPPGLSLVLTFRPRASSGGVTTREPMGRWLAKAEHAAATLTRLELECLDREGVAELVGVLLDGKAPSSDLVDRVYRWTDGLPFAIEEVVGLLRARGDLSLGSEGWIYRGGGLAVPAAVRDAVLARAARLPENVRVVLEAAAVIGRPFRQPLLATVTGLSAERVVPALSQALSSGMIELASAGGYEFRHALARQAIYEAMRAPQREHLHKRAADALESAAEPHLLGELASHYRQADLMADWLRTAEAAADLAMSLANDAAAVDQLRDIATSEDVPDETCARAAVKLGVAANEAGRHDEIIPVLEQLLARPDSIGERWAPVHWALGLLLAQTGDHDSCRAKLLEAVPQLQGSPAVAARAMATLGYLGASEGRGGRDLHWLDRAVEAAEQQDDRVVTAAVLADRAAALVEVGDPTGWEAARAVPRAPRSVAEARQCLRGVSNLVYAAVRIGHHEQAEAFMASGARLAATAQDWRLDQAMGANVIQFDWLRGRWEDLDSRIKDYLSDQRLLAPERLTVRAIAGLMTLATEGTDAAGPLLAAVMDHARADGLEGLTQVAERAGSGMIRLQLTRSRGAHAALEETYEVLEVVRSEGTWISFAALAQPAVDALVSAGQADEAAALVDEIADNLADRDLPAAQAGLVECRGIVALAGDDNEEAIRMFTSAEDRWSQIPQPYDAAQTAERRGRCLMTVGDQRGETPLLAALEGFEALGANWDAARTRRAMRQHGVSLAHRRPPKSYGTKLSPRERQVARRAASGQSNRQIAEELFLSPRTIEDHVANAMRKLNVDSRHDLPVGNDAG